MPGTGPSEYTIAAVSKLTGISCHALRAWERRYGIPCPTRSRSGHRRYDSDQVHILRAIARHLEQGNGIGTIMEEVRSGRIFGEAPRVLIDSATCVGSSTTLLDALMSMRLSEADRRYRDLALDLGPAELATQVLGPGLTEIGERWFRKECTINQERLASGFLIRKLQTLLDMAQRANANPSRLALAGAVQGERHEGGILIVCLLLELAGWRAINLGVDLPVSEFQDAVKRWNPDALGVSFVLSRNVNKRFRELEAVRDVPVFVGGRSILNYQGLARRHGLIPLPGPANMVIATMIELASDRVRR